MSYLFNNDQQIVNDEDNPVPINGVVTVSNHPDTQTIDGTVNIGTIPEVEIKNVVGGQLVVKGDTTNVYGRTVVTVDDDTVQHTSKNRRKVSTYEITDFATFAFSKNTLDFDELVVSGATGTHQGYLGMVMMSVSNTAGSSIIRQTKRVQRYLPGRANEATLSTILGTATGTTRRFGVFDDFNGAYFESNGTDLFCVVRRNTASGIVEERVARADWNGDKLDGTGDSGITLDLDTIQVLVIEYEWYGAGQVDWKFVIDNNAYSVHQQNHANLHAHTWAQRAALPIRYEFTNVSGVTSPKPLYHGSHSFLTEGTTTLLGKHLSVSTPITGRTLAIANTFYPLVAIRLKSTALNSVVIPDEYSAGCIDKTDIFVRAIQDATVTGGTWVSVGAESPLEYNITATGYTGGTLDSTRYISEKLMGDSISFPARAITQIGRKTTTTLGDTSQVFLISAAATDTNKQAWASLGWIEVR